jgi:hypothetical protein
MERAEGKAYAAGAAAMRVMVEARFSQWPSARFSGAEVVSQVHTMAGPTVPQRATSDVRESEVAR